MDRDLQRAESAHPIRLGRSRPQALYPPGRLEEASETHQYPPPYVACRLEVAAKCGGEGRAEAQVQHGPGSTWSALQKRASKQQAKPQLWLGLPLACSPDTMGPPWAWEHTKEEQVS